MHVPCVCLVCVCVYIRRACVRACVCPSASWHSHQLSDVTRLTKDYSPQKPFDLIRKFKRQPERRDHWLCGENDAGQKKNLKIKKINKKIK